MRQSIVGVVMCSVLAGCAAPNNHSWWEGWGDLASAGEEYQFDFSWELAGSATLAPWLLFSNAQQLWLQFASDAQIPALYALKEGVLTPVQAQRQGAYYVIYDRVGILQLRLGDEQVWAYKTLETPVLERYLHEQQVREAVQALGAEDQGRP